MIRISDAKKRIEELEKRVAKLENQLKSQPVDIEEIISRIDLSISRQLEKELIPLKDSKLLYK